MKKLLIAFLLLFSVSAFAQNDIKRDNVTAAKSLTITGTTVTGISNDTTEAAKRQDKLMTEKASKEYSDNHGGRRFPVGFGWGLLVPNDSTVKVDSNAIKDLAGWGAGGGGGTIDSSVWQKRWSVDTAKINIYNQIRLANLSLTDGTLSGDRYMYFNGHTLTFYGPAGYAAFSNSGHIIRQNSNSGSSNYSLDVANDGISLVAQTTGSPNNSTVRVTDGNTIVHSWNSSKNSYVRVNQGTVDIEPNDSMVIKNITAAGDTTYYKPAWVSPGGKVVKGYHGGGGTSGGIGYVVQSSAPTDTTKHWLDSTGGTSKVWELRQRLRNSWVIIGYYDPISNYFDDEPPVFIMCSGQSNMTNRTGASLDLTVIQNCVKFESGTWSIGSVPSGFNNLGFQTARRLAKLGRIVRYVIIAEASQPIEKWFADSTKTNEIVAAVTAAAIDSFNYFIFRQGERNGDLGDTEPVYAAKFYQVFDYYRTQSWFGKNCKVIACGINENYLNNGVFNFYQHINNSDKTGLGYIGVSMLGLSRVGALHIDGPSIDTAAERCKDAILGIVHGYFQEKTPNFYALGDNEFIRTPYSTIFPTDRWAHSSINGRKGGFVKLNYTTSQFLLGYNNVNLSTDAADTNSIYINPSGDVGVGAANNSITSNITKFKIQTTNPFAFTVGNDQFQIDKTGKFRTTVILNPFASLPNLRVHSNSGDIMNGSFAITRANMPDGSPSNSGLRIYLNGSANLVQFMVQGGVDTTFTNAIPVITMPLTGIGIGIKTVVAPTSTLQVAGSFSTAYVEKSANYTATINDNTIVCTTAGITITLPTAVGITGREYTIVNASSGNITVATTSSELIGNFTTATTLTIASDVSKKLKSSGTGYRIKN